MRYSLESTLPLNAFSPRGGRSPFALGMTLEGGSSGSWTNQVVNDISSVLGTDGGGGGIIGNTENIINSASNGNPLDVISAVVGTDGSGLGLSGALAQTDKSVSTLVPGGWATVALIAATIASAGTASPALAAELGGELAVEGAVAAGAEAGAAGAAAGGAAAGGAAAAEGTAAFLAADSAGLAAQGLAQEAIAQNLIASYGISAAEASQLATAASEAFAATGAAPAGFEAAAIGAAKGAAVGAVKNAATGDDILQGAALGALGGGVGAGVSGALDLGTAGNIIGGSAAGGATALATGRDPVTGLLSGAVGAGINAGVGQVVDTGSGLLNGMTGSTNTGTTQMEDWLTESGYYDNPANIDTYTPPTAGDFQMGGGSFSNQNYSVIPGELGDIIQDANGNIVLSSGADIQAAQSLGFDTTTLTNYAKQFGTQALKALLGGGGTAAQRSAFGLGQGGLLGAGANYFLNQNQLGRLNTAYGQNVAGQQAATKTAQEQASFTPVGMTTAFGSSNFGYDPRTGKLTSAGYTPTSQVAGQVQNLFGLGIGALPTTTNPQDIQNQYIAQQQGLLAPGREQQLAGLRNRQYQRGTSGLATGGTMAGYAPNAEGLMATNPELAAYYNSLAQEDARLAANAPTYAQNQLNQQIATGTGLFGAANTLEGYAQQPLSLSTALGTAGATAGAKAGYYGLLGNQNALATELQGQQANIYGQGAALGSVVNPLATALNTGITSMIPKTWLG
jgi:hypothetical protein